MDVGKKEIFELVGGDLRKFIFTYITEASKFSRQTRTLRVFELEIASRVANSLGIEESVVEYLHHPFHWKLFDSRNGSYFELTQSETPWTNSFFVKLKRDYDSDDVEYMTNDVFDKYGDHLESKLNSYYLKSRKP